MLGALPIATVLLPAQSPERPAARSYTGPGSCAAASCHGSVRAVTTSRIPQTEYTTWITQDRHAKATEVLDSPVSRRMARLLNIERAGSSPRCLGCHAIAAPAAQLAKSFVSEGVSCEACHGPASAWLGPHTTKGWTHAQSVNAGMTDTKNLVMRTENCASCHIGTADKVVDHEMIAAGHPDLVFDLEAFSAAMPRHWPASSPEDPWRSVRAWSVGQIVQLREGIDRLSHGPAKPSGPDFSELDCFSCHHSLTRADSSWRQEAGYPGRRPGEAPPNHARFIVARLIAQTIDAAAAARIDAAMTQPQAAAGLAPTLNALAQQASDARLDAVGVLRLIRAIVNDADRIAGSGERSAEQAAMSLEVLTTAYTQAGHADAKAVRAALDRLLQQLQNPSAYDPRRLAPAIRQVGEAIP